MFSLKLLFFVGVFTTGLVASFCTGPLFRSVYVKNAQGSIKYTCRQFNGNCFTLLLKLDQSLPLFIVNVLDYSGPFDSDSVESTSVSVLNNCIYLNMFQAFVSFNNSYTSVPNTDELLPVEFLFEILNLTTLVVAKYNNTGVIIQNTCTVTKTVISSSISSITSPIAKSFTPLESCSSRVSYIDSVLSFSTNFYIAALSLCFLVVLSSIVEILTVN